MAKQAVKIVRNSNRAFAFSTHAVAELRGLLGSSAGPLTAQLQMAVREHLGSCGKSTRGDYRGYPFTDDDAAEIRRMIAALRVVIKRIDQAPPTLRAWMKIPSLLSSLMRGDLNENQWERLRVFSQTAKDRLREFEVMAETLTRQLKLKRGRPKKLDRYLLSDSVAVVLRLGGVPVTAGHGGKFAKVLTTVLLEACGSGPEDMYRLTQEISRDVNRWTLEELRAGLKRSAPGSRYPAFWQQLASVQ